MSNESKSFDIRELVTDLANLVKESALSVRQPQAATKPSAEKVRLAVLNAVAAGPKNAAEAVSAISIASGGTLKLSSGEVQTALAALLDDDRVTSKNKGDRKVYSITPAGSELLASAAATAETEASQPSATSRKTSPTLDLRNCEPKFFKAASKLGPALLDIAQTASRDQQSRAAEILDNTRHELHVLLAEN